MFENARHYNEEGSMVYEDANLLEAMLKEKCIELGVFSGPGKRRNYPGTPESGECLLSTHCRVRCLIW